MNDDKEKLLLRNLLEWTRLQDAAEQNPHWRPTKLFGPERATEEAEHLAKVNGIDAEIANCERVIYDCTSVGLLKIMRANRHVLRF